MSAKAIDTAVLAHRSWVARFRSVIGGISTETFDPEEIRNDEICAFGKWLNSDPDCFGSAQSLEEVKLRHKHFHEIAAQIAIMLRQNYPQEQVDDYMTMFDEMSKQLVTHLLHVKSTLRE